MSVDEFLGMWLALTITVGYLGTVTLFVILVPWFVQWFKEQNGD
jgi:phosphatidylglycerophosphatase A